LRPALLNFSNALLGLFLWLGGLEFWQGLIFVLLLVGYNVVKIRSARKNRELHIGDDLEVEAMSIVKGLLFLLGGAAALRFGALQFVEGIASAAAVLGMSERFISVTLVAFGTSVPELAASMMAARKGESDIAIGNIIGSNIFNILSVLGFTALIQPITAYDPALFTSDFWVSVGLSLLIIPLMGWFTKDRLDRLEGALLLGIYMFFVANLLL
jgi:cation:H+ antiporter